MKLRNKETPNILGKIAFISGEDGSIAVKTDQGVVWYYNSLDKLNEEWEDAPEEAIQVHIEGIQNVFMGGGRVYIDYASAQEAEKAVRKLKAWKRLKDKGMRIYSFKKGKTGIDLDFYTLTILAPRDKDSLDLLFGGEE